MVWAQPQRTLYAYIVITLIRHEENQFRGNIICFSNYFIIAVFPVFYRVCLFGVRCLLHLFVFLEVKYAGIGNIF